MVHAVVLIWDVFGLTCCTKGAPVSALSDSTISHGNNHDKIEFCRSCGDLYNV